MCKVQIRTLILCTLINLAAAVNSSKVNTLPPVPMTQQNFDATFKRTSVLYGLSTISNAHLIEQRCHAHLQLFQHGVLNKQPWALKMFDASASIEPGFTFGNNFWLGSREVCNAVGHPVDLQTSAHLPHQMHAELLTSVAPFETDFRVVYLRYNSSWQVDPMVIAFGARVHVGLCLPSACTELQVQRLMQSYLSTDLLAGNELYDMHLEYDYVKDLKFQPSTFMRTSFFLSCVFVIATIGLTVAAVMFRKNEEVADAPPPLNDNNTPSHAHSELVHQQQLLACFDFQVNWRRLFAPPMANHTTAALNGARFGSALCVTFYHYLMLLFNGTRNKLTLFNYLVFAGNVDIFVDVFFTISGFLQAYNHFRNAKLLEMIRQSNFKQNLKLIGLHLFHRYLRLAPLYYLVIGYSDFGAKLIDDVSLFHIEHKMQVNCEKYWWRNVFFIQNFFDHNDMCGLWTWSLACDMQFAILATLLLFSYVKHPRNTKICLAALVVANILYTYFIGITMKFDHSLESTFALLTENYMNPLSRILAPIAGGIAGWVCVEQRRLPFALSKNTQQFLGYLVPIVFFGCILKPPNHNLSPFTSTSVLLLERVLFTSMCSILIVSNAFGHMRWFFRIFETSLFQKFNKVAYAMFLLNPLLIFSLPAFSQSNLYANLLNMIVEYIGLAVIVVIFSIIFTLLFDIPYQNLSRLLIIHQIKQKPA